MKYMYKKLYLVMSLIIAFIVLFTACGNQNSSNVSTGSTEKAVSTAAETTATKADTSEEVNLKIILVGDKQKDADIVYAEVNKRMKELINATLEPIYLSWSDYSTKYPLMFASGEDFDLAYTSLWCMYVDQANKGGFYPLTMDLIQKNMPTTYKTVTEAQWTQTKIKGNIYMVPYTTKESNHEGMVVIRGDLREKYGIKPLENQNDLVTYWDAIAKNEKGIYPLVPTSSAQWITNVFFSYNPSLRGFPCGMLVYDSSQPDSSKLTSLFDLPEYLEFFKLMKTFQEKGYWPKNTLANQINWDVVFKEGKSATEISNPDNVFGDQQLVMQVHPEWKPEVYDLRPDVPIFAISAACNGVGVHVASKNVDRALMALEQLLYDRQLHDLTYYGIEGKHWIAVGDDKFKVGPEKDNFPAGSQCPWGWNSSLNRIDASSTQQNIDFHKKIDTEAITPPLSLFTVDDSNIKTENASVNEINGQYLPILVYGFANDVEKTYNEWLTKLKNAGLEKIQGEMQKQADAFIAQYGK